MEEIIIMKMKCIELTGFILNEKLSAIQTLTALQG
jgi:hypothetical protein